MKNLQCNHCRKGQCVPDNAIGVFCDRVCLENYKDAMTLTVRITPIILPIPADSCERCEEDQNAT